MLQRLQTLLGHHARSYLSAVEASGVAAVAEHTRAIGSVLARLLGEHLEVDSEWQRGRWIDDLTNVAIAVGSSQRIEVRGLMVWGEQGTTQQWVEPFFATISAFEEDRVPEYTLAFAIAADGLGRWPYGKRVNVAARSALDEWAFAFHRGSVGDA
jgi:hypothetical protein